MKKFDTYPPAGTRDFLPEDVKAREQIFSTLKEVFEHFGFLPIDTPAFERIEIMTGKYGKENEKLIFKILKRGEGEKKGEADLALRYDLTVPLARFFAKYQNQLPRPFRRYQISPVWRADRPGKGRFREFYQCDIDIVGSQSTLADAEVILTLAKSLSRLKLTEYVVHLNSRKIIDSLLEVYNISADLRSATLVILDKLDKIGNDGVIEELKNYGFPKTTIDWIRDDLTDENRDINLRKKINLSHIGRQGLEEVDEIISLVAPMLKNGEEIKFSPFLVRGLGYYTGPIFEIYPKDFNNAVASGGRYDNLIGMFINKTVPACGGSLGIDRIISTFLQITNQSKENRFSLDAFVTVWDSISRIESLRIANELRDAGLSTEIFLGEGKISNQISSASTKNALYCLFYGPDEQAKKEIKLKNLSTGAQESVKRDQITTVLCALIKKP